MNERILCAAIWYQELTSSRETSAEFYLPRNIYYGVVFCGHRHSQCIHTKCALTGLRDAESGAHEQGFLTSENRFVGREEALEIALREGQILNPSAIRGKHLYSEDLY